MSTFQDIGNVLGGDDGLASGAADIISALKGTPQSVTYVTNTPTTSTISPTLLIVGGLILFVVLFMVVKQE